MFDDENHALDFDDGWAANISQHHGFGSGNALVTVISHTRAKVSQLGCKTDNGESESLIEKPRLIALDDGRLMEEGEDRDGEDMFEEVFQGHHDQ